MGKQAVAAISVSHANAAKHIQYICRSEAVQPAQSKERHQPERVREQVSAAPHLDHQQQGKVIESNAAHLKEERASALKQLSEEQSLEHLTDKADAVWTWNAPSYVTGDKYGTHQPSATQNKSEHQATLSLEEKIENAQAYFGLLSDAEKLRGGVNSYRAVLTIKGEASNREMQETVNDFLRENFPQAQALVAVHRNTSHVHAHLYVHSRQLDGKKINLGQSYFHLDESWAKVCSEHFKDQTIYEEHLRLKSATQAWKRERAQASKNGQSLPIKSGRWADLYEIKHGVVHPWDDQWVGRLRAVTRIAETKADYLRATNSPEQEIIEAGRELQELQQKLTLVAEKRLQAHSAMKREMPAEIVTLEEQKELARYMQAIRDVGATRQIRVNDQMPSVQAAFDFMKQPAEQLTFGFHGAEAEKVSTKQTKAQARKPKTKSKEKPQTIELRPEKTVIEKSLSPEEAAFYLQLRQREAREQQFQAAQAETINELRLIGQAEGVISNPQEFARTQSTNLHQKLFENHGLSISDLGYTREAWAMVILSRVSEAFRRESANHLYTVVAQAERELDTLREAIEAGEERMLTLLYGRNSHSHSSDIPGHEQTWNHHAERSAQREKDVGARSSLEPNHSQSAQEQIYEITDRLEHIFIR
jgi:hypothetical protein